MITAFEDFHIKIDQTSAILQSFNGLSDFLLCCFVPLFYIRSFFRFTLRPFRLALRSLLLCENLPRLKALRHNRLIQKLHQLDIDKTDIRTGIDAISYHCKKFIRRADTIAPNLSFNKLQAIVFRRHADQQANSAIFQIQIQITSRITARVALFQPTHIDISENRSNFDIMNNRLRAIRIIDDHPLFLIFPIDFTQQHFYHSFYYNYPSKKDFAYRIGKKIGGTDFSIPPDFQNLFRCFLSHIA